MGITSLQVCMDSSDWLQATISEEGTGMDSSPITTPSGLAEDNLNLTCSRPLIERRLRPHHEQSLKCPRCESTHTKFCYYNNYSLSQPRYFCKTCRRYWTKGGTLRNIPVGGGCRKNKKVSKKNPSSSDPSPPPPQPQSSSASLIPLNHPSPLVCYENYNQSNSNTDLQLAFPEQLQFFNNAGNANPNFPIDFMESKYEALILGNHDLIGNGEGFGSIHGGEFMANANNNSFHGFCSPLGFSSSLDHGNSSSSQRLLQPYDYLHHHHQQQQQELDPTAEIDVKPNKMLAIEWNDHNNQQGCNSDPGYGFGSWTGLMNGYGSSATNPLV